MLYYYFVWFIVVFHFSAYCRLHSPCYCPLNLELMSESMTTSLTPSLQPPCLSVSPGNGHRGGRERHPGPEHEEVHQAGGQPLWHQPWGALPRPLLLRLLFLLPPSGRRQWNDVTAPRPSLQAGVGGASGLHQAQPPTGGGHGRGQEIAKILRTTVCCSVGGTGEQFGANSLNTVSAVICYKVCHHNKYQGNKTNFPWLELAFEVVLSFVS